MRRVFAAVVVGLIAVAPAGAEDAATSRPAAPSDDSRVLVLGTAERERILIGRVTEHEGHVIFERKGGRMTVPRDQVRGIYASLEALYLEKRETIDAREPVEHLRLARWCLTYKLRDQAKAELQAVLQLEPKNQTAQIMLRSLESTRATSVVKPPPAASQPDPWSRQRENLWRRWMKAQPKRTLGSFVQNVQPILLNSCGSGRCHGNPRYTGDFRLSRWEPGHRVPPAKMIENLRATFSALDLDEPGRSPLLLKPLMSKVDPPTHPGGPVLSGPRKKRVWNTLRKWVMSLRPPEKTVPVPRRSDPDGGASNSR